MNILLNNYCNLKCPYCFANEIIQEQKQNMSIEDFIYVLNFLTKSKSYEIGLLGGEPTLHPNFLDFLDILNQNPQFNNLLIFTNGLFTTKIRDKFIDIQNNKKIVLLINLNSPNNTDITNKQYLQILDNIQILSNVTNLDIVLGLNIFKQNQDIEYIIDVANKYNIKSIRWTIVSPNTYELKHINMIECFMGLKDQQIKFLYSSIKHNIETLSDCNQIPYCVFTKEETEYFSNIMPDVVKKDRQCFPVLDIKPNLDVIRCYMFQEYPVKLKDFETVQDIYDYFIKNIDSKFNRVYAVEQCKTCNEFKVYGKSCGCLGFYKNKVNL